MAWYDDRASDRKRAFISAESGSPLGSEIDEYRVKQAIVYARVDIMLLVSYLMSLNSQVRTIKWFIGIGVSFYILNLPFWQNI